MMTQSPDEILGVTVQETSMPFVLPMACASPSMEHIQWALLKEKHYPGVRDPTYLSSVQQHGMTAAWRLRVCRWMFETAKEFKLHMDSVATALHFLDQFLSAQSVDRATLQLLGMICMWSATKMTEGQPILLEEMALMCERKFSRVQMVDAEAQLARLLAFRFNPPNVFTMARDLVHELPIADVAVRDNCVTSVFQLLERVLEDVTSLSCSASSLAKAAVQLVARTDLKMPVKDICGALKPVQIQEVPYRAAFKLMRTAYFGSKATTTVTAKPSSPVAPAVAETIKPLAESPAGVEDAPVVRERVSPRKTEPKMLDYSFLYAHETLDSPSPSPVALASPAASRTVISTLGVARDASSLSRDEGVERPSDKRQRRH